VLRRAAYRRWRARVPMVLAGPRPPRKLRPWPVRLLRSVLGAGVGLGLVLVLLVAVAAIYGGRSFVLPVWAVAETETRLNRALAGRALVILGGVGMGLGPRGQPQVMIEDLRLKTPDGQRLVAFPEVRLEFDRSALLQGALRPVRMVLGGARIDLRRDPEGQFDFALDGLGEDAAGMGLPEAMALAFEVIDLPFLSQLDRIEAGAIGLSLQDERAGRLFEAGDGRAVIERQGQGLALDAGFGLVDARGDPATLQVTVILPREAEDPGAGRILARFDQIAAADLAAQTLALGFLSVLDTPISGQLRASFDGRAVLRSLEGQLSLGSGVLQPLADLRPIALDSAELALAYDPVRQRLDLSQITLRSPTLGLSGRGHVDLLRGDGAALPLAFVGQMEFDHLVIDPVGVFESAVDFDGGAMDLRLRLDPFSLDLGQLQLRDGARRLEAQGGISAGAGGWTVALDVAMDAVRHDRLLALWPLALVPNTRAWIARNVLEGELLDLRAGLRLRPEHAPRLSLGYDFAGADVRILPDLPPISDGHGHAMMEGESFVLSVDRGQIDVPQAGRIDVSRSVFKVVDVTQRPPIAEISLRTDSSLEAALSLLDRPPFNLVRANGLRPDLAEARALIETRVTLPLLAALDPKDVSYEVTGRLEEVRSDRLVPGRVLRSDALQIVARPQGLEISGAGDLSGIGFDGRWFWAPGQAARLESQIEVSPAFVSAFLPGVVQQALAGAARAQVEISLPRGEPASYVLTSDLVGLGVKIAPLGWDKPARSPARLRVEGGLGQDSPSITRFSLAGAGLEVRGTLAPPGDLQLEQLKLGDWLDVRASLDAKGGMQVTGGRADLRKLPNLTVAGAAGSGGGGVTGIRLDSLRISDSLTLEQFSGRLAARGSGLGGSFAGLVNGRAAVDGLIEPGRSGPMIYLRSDNGAAVLAAMGLFSTARGGKLEVEMTQGGPSGHWQGVFSMTEFRVREMPALAELLGAITLVGLIDQLGGEGIAFNDSFARFRLTPRALEITEARATGASFGLTLEGVYDMRADMLDLQGVISPLYILNAIGQAVSRPGEGLVGVNYRIRGAAKAPQVTANPLSALAPGFLRNLFRGPASRLEDLR